MSLSADEFLAHAVDAPYNAHYDRPAMFDLIGDVRGKDVLDAGHLTQTPKLPPDLGKHKPSNACNNDHPRKADFHPFKPLKSTARSRYY